ncbi:fungal pheromone STE3G-protein-coupled receptor [Rickenella mellea]|uniref:Fungal pheromone STE3G-protein-coupled receptor n=1 Tax=Rickenella mellea TaxID=50990 RepID=A0A4Y7PPD9_9AGAM|nr:fungal pheromone STE3G-protein-coupled receptor [Rickenella mellea]
MDLHPTYPIFPIIIFLSFVATLLPLAWIKRDNTGLLLLVLWLAIACLNQFINSVIWHGNTRNFVPVWCDISSRLIVGISVGIPCSALCMTRRLYHVCSMKALLLTTIQKRRALVEDMCICVGIPFLQVVIHYVVGGHRYAILEDIGCYPATYNSWLAYVLAYSWPVIIGFLNGIYSVLTIRAIIRSGKEIDKCFEEKDEKKHYCRRIAFALGMIIFDGPFAVVSMTFDLTTMPLYPYNGWKETHVNYSHVVNVPAAVWRLNPTWNAALEMARWILILDTMVYYGIFGTSREAINAYKKAFWTVIRVLGLKFRSSATFQDNLQL